MNKLIKKYIFLILFLVSNFLIFPVNAMKTAKTQVTIPSYEELIIPNSQSIPRPSSLPTIPQQSDHVQNNYISEMHYGTQRNRLLKKCFCNIISSIKSLFQKQSDINILINI